MESFLLKSKLYKLHPRKIQVSHLGASALQKFLFPRNTLNFYLRKNKKKSRKAETCSGFFIHYSKTQPTPAPSSNPHAKSAPPTPSKFHKASKSSFSKSGRADALNNLKSSPLARSPHSPPPAPVFSGSLSSSSKRKVSREVGAVSALLPLSS
jgi:hypothetical protein